KHYQESWEDDVHTDLEWQGDITHQVDGHRLLERAIEAIDCSPTNMQKVHQEALEMDGNTQETDSTPGAPVGPIRLPSPPERLTPSMSSPVS
ncbi:hypothetical protein EWW49_29255, partial [Pseudomonas syringae]